MSPDNAQFDDRYLEDSDFRYPSSDSIALAVYHDMQNRPGPSVQHASHHATSSWNNTSGYGLQIPIPASATADSHHAQTLAEPIATTLQTDPTHAQMSDTTPGYDQSEEQVFLHDMLNLVGRQCGESVREQLSACESSLKERVGIDSLKHANDVLNRMNAEISGLQTAIENKLEAVVKDNEQRRREDEQSHIAKLGPWKEEIQNSMKVVIKQTQASEKLMEKVGSLVEKSSSCLAAAVHSSRSLEEKVIEQHDAIKSVEEKISINTLSLLNRLEALDLRIQEVENILSAAASSLAASTSSSALVSAVSAVSLDGTSDLLAATASMLEPSSVSTSAIATDSLPSSVSRTQAPSTFTKMINLASPSKPIVVQLAETSIIDVSELRSTRDKLLEKSEEIGRMDNAQDKSIQDDFRVSPTAAGADDDIRAPTVTTPVINAGSADSNADASLTATTSPSPVTRNDLYNLKALEEEQRALSLERENHRDPGK